MRRESSEIAAAVDAGSQSATLSQRLTTIPDGLGGEIPLVLLSEGQKAIVPPGLIHYLETRAPQPSRKRGMSTHHEIASFIDHVNRQKGPTSAIWADIDQTQVVAIYNYHGASSAVYALEDMEARAGSIAPGWLDHGATYTMPLSEQWKRWTAQADEAMGQDDFADWLDAYYEDMAHKDGFPQPLELLELARNLQIFTKGQFARRTDPTTGEHSLICKEEHSENSTKIPRAFLIGIPVFRGGQAYAVECRIRFRVNHGRAAFSYTMHRADEILRDAFADAVTEIGSKCEDVPVFWGVAEEAKVPPRPPNDGSEIPF
jgi:uncharacterized protein YfdQ (DUF2303 family)